jgi:hypothetical protein
MKIILFLIAVASIGCASQPKTVDYGGALPELYRAGTPQVEPYPNYYHRISHTCVSTPIYDLYGYYTRTDVRCW